MRRNVNAARIAILIVLAGLFALAAPAQTLTVERLDADGWARPDTANVIRRWTAVNPEASVRVDLPRDPHGHWLRFRVDRDVAEASRRVIVLRSARAYGAVGYYPPGSARISLIGYVRDDGPQLLRRGWALPLEADWKAGVPAYGHFNERHGTTLNVGLADRDELMRELESDRRFAIVVYALMLAMTLVVAGYWAVSRDPVYLYYCGYMICLSVYLLMMTAWIKLPVEWLGSAAQRDGAPWFVATLTTMFQLCFTVRFLELPRLLPRAATALRAIVWANAIALVVLVLAFDYVYQYWFMVGNGLLLLAIPIIVYAAIAAWRRGAQYAGYYLIGWTPLLLFAGLLAAKTFGFGDSYLTERGLLLAVVLEAGVLMIALTQLAADRRRRMAPRRPGDRG